MAPEHELFDQFLARSEDGLVVTVNVYGIPVSWRGQAGERVAHGDKRWFLDDGREVEPVKGVTGRFVIVESRAPLQRLR